MSQSRSPADLLIGTWRLKTHTQETVETGAIAEPRGPHPKGLITYTGDGRFSIIAAPERRRRPAQVMVTDDEALDLFRGLTSYAGGYSVEGDVVIHHVEVSWNEIWADTAQRRRFVVDENELTIIAGPDLNPRDGKLAISTLIWDRVR